MGRKKKIGKQTKDGGQSGAKKSSVHSGPAQVISREVEKEVPAREEVEVAEETEVNWDKKRCVNVLFIGHAGAGKSKALQKILKLGGKHESTIQKLKAIEDRSRESRSMADMMAICDDVKGTAAEFGEAKFETETTRYHILEAPSHYHYVYKMTSRALQADIAVLWVSGSKDDLPPNEKIQQTCNCIKVITTLNIPKILLVVNKMDDPSWTRKSFEDIVSRTCNVVKSLSLSCEADSDIPILFDSLDTVEVPLQTSERLPFRSGKENPLSIEYLVITDKYLDDAPFDGGFWYCRAKILLTLGNYSEAFEAADKARECDYCNSESYKKQKDPLKYKLEGDQFRAIRQFNRALEYYETARAGFKGKQCEKAARIVENIIKEMNREKIWVEVLAKVEKNLGQSPNDAALWYRKAKLLAELKSFEEAFKAAEKALECNYFGDPSHKKDDYPLFYKMEGDQCRARKNFGGAVEKYISACNGFLKNKCEKAVEIIQEVINECLNQDEKVKQQMNELKKIREEDLVKIDQLLLQDPKNAASWYKKAKILADLQKFVEAFEAAQKASDYNYLRHPLYEKECHPLFYKMEGDNYYGMEKFDDARELYIKARNVYESDYCEEVVCLLQDLVHKACTALFSSENVKMKKGVEKKKSSDEVEEKEVEEEEIQKRQTVELDQYPSSSNLSRKIKFKMTLYVTMEELDENSCMGSTKTNTTEVRKSFIVAEPSDINNIQDLVDLCLTHENLLKIDQSLKTLDEGRLMLLTSEDVCSIQCFFKHKLSEIFPQSQESNEAWWEAIKDVFWKVFRGVIRGLMHLFVRGKSCGHLVFRAFVTSKEEGRILPSMEKAKQKQDLIDLVDLMQSVIKLPVPHQSDLSFLPYDLNHFFILIYNVDWSIPLEFLIDHPYFKNVAEKIDFTFKLRKLVKRKSAPLLLALAKCKYYEFWWLKLVDVYHLLYVKAKEHDGIKEYRLNVDIVQYFCAVYTHVNEYEYKAVRNHKRFTDEKIESDLAKIFPNFYVDMFYCLCMCKGELDYADFMGLSTVLSHDGRAQIAVNDEKIES